MTVFAPFTLSSYTPGSHDFSPLFAVPLFCHRSVVQKQEIFSIFAVTAHLRNAHLCSSVDQYQSSSHESQLAINDSSPYDDVL